MININEIQKSDLKEIIEWNRGKSESFLYQWAGMTTYKYPISEEQIVKRMSHNEIIIFKIQNNEEIVGTVEINKPDKTKKSIRFGKFLIGENYRGKGYGKKTIQLLEDYLYNKYEIEELELGVFEFNKSAKRLYEQLGFEVKAVIINEKDSNWNLYTMIKKR